MFIYCSWRPHQDNQWRQKILFLSGRRETTLFIDRVILALRKRGRSVKYSFFYINLPILLSIVLFAHLAHKKMAEVVTKKVKSVAYPNDDGSYFKKIIYPERLPVILKSVNIGTACSTWTPNYLANALGDIPVKVHVCAVSELDFLKKNFLYKTMNFNNFMNRVTVEGSHKDYFICPEEKYYLRSLGVDARKDVADIRKLENNFPDYVKISFSHYYLMLKIFFPVFSE